jgi:hypothetical protein
MGWLFDVLKLRCHVALMRLNDCRRDESFDLGIQVNLSVSLSTTSRICVVRMGINLSPFFTGEQDGGEWLASSTGHITPGAKETQRKLDRKVSGPQRRSDIVKLEKNPVSRG